MQNSFLRRHWILLLLCLVLGIGIGIYEYGLKPTRILIVNALPAVRAEIAMAKNSRWIALTFRNPSEINSFDGYDMILFYGRSLYLDEKQTEALQRVIDRRVPIFTYALRNFTFDIKENLTEEQVNQLHTYCQHACWPNYVNMLHYMRHIATPHRWMDQTYEDPILMPENMYYHLEAGRYFKTHDLLTEELKRKGLYHEQGKKVAFISGVTFPVEGCRPAIDTLMVRLIRKGYNLYPITASGRARVKMLQALKPEAIIYLPMGKIGDDQLIQWLYKENIPLFTPYPLLQSHEEWLDRDKPVTGGTLNARILIPEVDGGIDPLCIATQNDNGSGLLFIQPEEERMQAFVELFDRHMQLRNIPNKEKKVAIAYFKTPGHDALLASGMEVVPSLYALLSQLKQEGYDVSSLPNSEAEFKRQIMSYGSVLGDYATGAQEALMNSGKTVWIDKATYEQWANRSLPPEKYQEVVEHYGKAPGTLLARGDSIAIAALQFGNILLFPQPRPALGSDAFKLVHGVDVPPPHSYLAPYLYMKYGFCADLVLHFGTHGNLEFTPGKNVALSGGDWADALLGNLPHFYLYTTGNVGEGIIAKRRSHAVLITHLTPPYVESGMRQQTASVLALVHKALTSSTEEDFSVASLVAKEKIVQLGYHRGLELDSICTKPYTREELEKVDAFVEELANEKVTGAYYTLGTPYSQSDLFTTVEAIYADQLAYTFALQDKEKGRISAKESEDFTYITHHYLPQAKQTIQDVLGKKPVDQSNLPEILRPVQMYEQCLLQSPEAEVHALLRAFDGGAIAPAPGGDPVLNPNVLPTGRNMYSINTEATPTEKAWADGRRLVDQTLEGYKAKHGDFPQKVSYTFWAGEFISSEGTTIAQALYMLGVEPLRDTQGRVVDLKLIPSETLGRPRIDVMIQISGQLRDLAASRLKMLTKAIQMAAESKDDCYPNHVAAGTLIQQQQLLEQGESPQRAKDLSIMRIFGPVNAGYSTGMLGYTEHSGAWEDEGELAEGFVQNMSALYGDEEHWGISHPSAMKAAIDRTDLIVQPRQSNTWGPVSLDHVYEFTGSLSLAVRKLSGKEPDAMLADYRNRNIPRIQETKQAIAIETLATILNPTYIQERMKGDATTASMFGEIFRNLFGWSVMRPSSLDPTLYDQLYEIYMKDRYELGIEDYFRKVNPAALQEMTATMLESARKGYWKATPEALMHTAEIHARLTEDYAAPCTEFVCGNPLLQAYIFNQLDESSAQRYQQQIQQALQAASASDGVVLQKEELSLTSTPVWRLPDYRWTVCLVVIVLIFVYWIRRQYKQKREEDEKR